VTFDAATGRWVPRCRAAIQRPTTTYLDPADLRFFVEDARSFFFESAVSTALLWIQDAIPS
jgi:hypothetical protein